MVRIAAVVVLLLGAAACKEIGVEPSPSLLDDSYVPFSRD